MADGTIRIGTKLDLSGLKANVKELERELNNVRKEQAKVDAQADKTNQKYEEEREFDAQFPEEFSHREDIDKRAAKELDPIIAKQEELNQKEQYYLEKLTAANAKLQEQSQIAQASKELDGAVKSDAVLDKVKTQEQYNSLLAETKAKMASIEAHAERIATQNGVSKDKILAANPAYQKLSDTMNVLKSTTKQFGNEAERAGDKAKTGLKKAKKESNGFTTAIKKGVKKLGMMALAVFGIRSAYNAVRMAATEYLSTNEQLKGQIDTLKVGFGQVLGPAIEWLVKLLMQAVSAVNTFVYALTGINYVAKANEAALKKQGKAAKEANAQLAGFDEMNKLSDSSSSSSSPVGNLDATIGDISGFMEQLKNQILAGDWYGAGSTIGETLMDGMYNIDWSNLGSKIGEILSGAVSFALGLALSIDPLVLLSSAAELLAGFLDGVTKTIQGMDWQKVGRDIVDLFVKGLIASMILTNPFYTLIALIFTPEGNKLTSSASELVGSIIGALLSAIVGAAKRIGEIGTEIWNTIKTHFDKYVDWEGTPEEIVEGLFNGIVDAIKGVGNWIYNNIWIPFRDGFKKAFDINSPSKKMENFGGYIIDGLYNGITGGIAKIKKACTDTWKAIKEKFSGVGTWFETTFKNAWQKVKDVFSKGGKIFNGIKEGIASTFKTIVNGLIDGINKIIKTPFKAINDMLNTVRSVSVLGVKPFKDLWDKNPLTIPQIPKLAVGGIVNRPGRGVPAIIGEAGAEAVLPLENNTEWMDVLADKIGGNVTIPIYMDGKKIATYVVDIQKKKAFAMNGV